MGEHAVVYGRPALTAAVDLRLRASLELAADEGRSEVELHLPQIGHRERIGWPDLLAYARAARRRWRRYAEDDGRGDFEGVRGEDPAHLVKAALGEVAEHLGEETGPGLRLAVDSEIPIGSGFGSSAALAVAVMAAYLRLRGEAVPVRELERLALEVERRQHGFPSGVDSATVVHGGLVWARNADDGEGMSVRPLAGEFPHLERFRAFDTGTPAQSTGEVVAAVRRRIHEERERMTEELDRMGRLTERFREALSARREDVGPVVELVRRYEASLEAIGVVPEAARDVVRRVEEEGGAAKISGAGALASPPDGPPAAGSLLVYHPEPGRIDRWGFLEGLRRYPLSLGAAGYRVEEAG